MARRDTAPQASTFTGMTRAGLPRWAAPALAALLVGAVLLMHGLDAGATPAPAGDRLAAPAPIAHSASTGDHGSGAGCESCSRPHHFVAACVAVIAAVTVARAARHVTGRLAHGYGHGRLVVAGQLTRPRADRVSTPDPAWVRLSVMRC